MRLFIGLPDKQWLFPSLRWCNLLTDPYILAIRINNAVSLLETTDYNVTEIAAIIGYDNPLYFSRIFRKQKRISPSDFHKLRQAEEENK